MLQNATEFEPGAVVEADTCIIGSGPAGLALALQLKKRGLSCVLLESGVTDYNDTHQSVGQLDNAFEFGNLQERMIDERRQIGGKSNAWSIESERGVRGVRLLPYNAANFAARPAMGGIAWPMTREELDPYYALACEFFDIPGNDWAYSEADGLPMTSDTVKAMRFRFSDGEVLTQHVRETIIPSDKIRLICNATALKLNLDPETRAISSVNCESEPGRPFTVKARQVVVSGGALSTTGLLLRSDDVIEGGIGNHSGLLGRYFMDHPLIDGGELVVKDTAVFDKAGAYDLTRDSAGLVMAHLQISEDNIRNEPVANINAMLYPRPRLRELSVAYQEDRVRAQKAWQVLKSGRASKLQKLGACFTLVLHAGYIVEHLQAQKDEYNSRINRGGWSVEPGASKRYKAFNILHICEQAPNIDNRVRLGTQLDRFGQKRVTIDWNWSDEDRAAVKRAQEHYIKTFSEGGWGEYKLLRDRLNDPMIVHSSLGHHIGTTRMHVDPKQGVTDANAKVHGVANLYVASSALFPSGGWENPTLTVVALAIRVAEHIAGFA